MRVEIPNTITATIGGLISRGVKAVEVTDGGRLVFTLPDGSARGLVFCKKISQTPTVYPRNGGKIAKKPL